MCPSFFFQQNYIDEPNNWRIFFCIHQNSHSFTSHFPAPWGAKSEAEIEEQGAPGKNVDRGSFFQRENIFPAVWDFYVQSWSLGWNHFFSLNGG